MESQLKPPLNRRINVRLLVVFGIVFLVVGWAMYLMIRITVTGGIEQRKEGIYVDLKAMSNFEMDQIKGTRENIPPQFRALDGKRVILEGEMYTPLGATNDFFQLVYSIQKCCFQGTKKVQHFVDSTVTKGATIRFPESGSVVRVQGILHVNVVRDGGQISSIYQLDVEKLEGI